MEQRPVCLDNKGYTLVELIAVVVVVGILLTFTAPRLRDGLLNDPLKAVARKLVGMVQNLRNEAVREHRTSILHADLNAHRFWTTDTAMTEDEQNIAREQAFALPESVRFRDIWIRGKGKIVDGEARILFTPKGYTQMSAIHLRSEDGREMTLALSPFLSKINIRDTYVEFD